MIGADVRGRAFAPDVLLARGQGQAECAAAFAVEGLPDQPPGHLTDMRGTAREKSEARAAELQWHPEALPFAHGDVSAERARRLQQRERQRLGGDRNRESA